ncbi:MAG TPA: metallophosphoesterase [Longimicrobiales bacterium]
MLVVISDLHFEEERSCAIESNGRRIEVDGNIGPRAFHLFIDSIEQLALRNNAERIDLVLAGDVFDLNRTCLWFEEGADGPRPYVSCADVGDGSELERKLLRILDGIATEPRVEPSLAALRRLGAGGQPVDVMRHYLPGNHDRLINATPALRARARALLGMDGGDAPFPHQFLSADPRVLVRHGHEYDHLNFAGDHRRTRIIPAQLPDAEYDALAFGDIVTVDIASRLPWQFVQHHGAEAILGSALLSDVYVRLLDFDDVRPNSALLDFLLRTPGHGEAKVWRTVAPVLRDILADLNRRPVVRKMLKRLPLLVRGLVENLMESSARGQTVSHREIRVTEKLAELLPGGGAGPAEFAAREAVIRDGTARFVICGHTHHPEVTLLAPKPPLERYYVDTGTWRHRIPATKDISGFGRIKALSYAVVWASREDPTADGRPKTESLDYWDGVTQRWS